MILSSFSEEYRIIENEWHNLKFHFKFLLKTQNSSNNYIAPLQGQMNINITHDSCIFIYDVMSTTIFAQQWTKTLFYLLQAEATQRPSLPIILDIPVLATSTFHIDTYDTISRRKSYRI